MKHKKVKKLAIGTAIVAVIVAAALGILSAFGINLFSCSKNIDPGEAPDSMNISAAPPEDGSLPTAHTGIENISYMVYVLDNQSNWHSYSETVSDAAGGINHQLTYTYKDYKGGVLIASDMTSSTFVKSSTQTAYVGDGAYIRTGSDPKSTDITEITWNDGEPEYLQRQSYYEKYGLFADEISVFILNEETVSSCGEVADNGDGTYTQSFTLDPSSSTYYYQFNMKTRGGLSAYPEFSAVNITFTFNADWEVLKVSTTEVSAVQMGVISTTNTSTSEITYTYGDDCVDEYNYSFYESYFKQYVGNVAEGGGSSEDKDLTVTDVLQYGFGEVLSGGKQYAIDVYAGESYYTGYIYASVDLNTLSSDTLGAIEIRLSLGKTAEEQMLYIELSGGEIAAYYSDSFAVSANLSELSLIIDNISSWIGGTDDGAQTVTVSKTLTASESEEEEDALTQLLSLFVITETDDGATLSLNTDDLLGTGIGIDLSMDFAKDDENVLVFTNASVGSITYGGEQIAVSVSLSDTDAEVITRNEEMTPANLADFVADVYDLLSSDLLEVSLTLDGNSSDYSSLDGLYVEAAALVDINSVVVGADVYVNYTADGGSLSAKLSAYYDYNASEYGNIYLYLYELDGKAVSAKLYCNIDELALIINVLLSDGESSDGGNSEGTEEIADSVAQIINSILTIDFSSVVTELYASGTQIRLGVDLDKIMTLLGAEDIPALGTAALVYDGGKLALALEALGLSVDIAEASGGITEPDASEYLDVTQLLIDIYSLISSRSFNFALTLDGNSENCTIDELSGLAVSLTAEFDTQTLVLSADAAVSYTYNNNNITAKFKIYYVYGEENYGTAYVNLYEVCGKAAEVKLCADVSDIDELADGLLSGIIESADISSEDGTEFSAILEALIAFDYNSAITVLDISQSGITLGLDADNVLSQFGVEVSGIGALGLVYSDNEFAVTAENLGLSAALKGSDSELAIPDDADEYLDLTAIITAVERLINSKTITAEIAISDSSIGYLEGVELNGTINYTIASGLLKVDLEASYQGINVVLTAYYDGEAVYLAISEIAGAGTDIKVKCGIAELTEVLGSLLGETSSEVSVATSEVLEVVLSLNYGEIITRLEADADEGIILSLDIDELLTELEVSLGIDLGEIELSYRGGEIAVAAAYAGITANVSGASGMVTLPVDASDYFDIIAAATDIYSIIQSDIININVSIDGGTLLGGLVEGGYLDGVAVTGDIAFTTDGAAVYADLEVSYSYGGENLSLGLQAYYDGAAIYLLIDELNGAAAFIGVSCQTDTLSEVLAQLFALADGGESTEGEQAAADVVTILLAMDYSQIIGELTAYGTELTLSVDVDAILSQLAADGIISDSISGYTFGTLRLDYSGNGALTLAANALGVEAVLNGESGTLSKPAANYLSVESVLALYESVMAEIGGIQTSQSVGFDIDCYVTADDLTLGIYGMGEVDWSNGTTVALDLTLYIADGSSNPDKIDVKLLYSAEGITFIVGELGITATADDIDGLQEGFTQLLTAITALAGTSGSSLENSQTVSALSGLDVSAELNNLLLSEDMPAILTALLAVISSTDWVEGLSDLRLTVDGASAVFSYLDGCTITFTADGGFALTAVSANGNEDVIKVTSGTGLYAELESGISSGEYTIMSTEDGAKLTEIIYGFGLGVISSSSIANTLGTDTYEISFMLDGDISGVSSLQGVTVEATLYYTDTVTTAAGESKLTEMDLNMDIGGVTAVFNIIYYDESLYITLTNINNTELHDLKLTVALGDVYDIADQLVEVLLNTNLTDYFASGAAAASEETETDGQTAASISETLVKLLSLDFNKLVGCSKTVEADGTITRSVWVDIDAVYTAFADGGKLGLGTVTAQIITYTDENGKTRREISAQGVYNGGVWLEADAKRATTRDYSSFDTTEYWDLAFLKYLISDAVDFATDGNGDIYTIYTFSGDLTASVVGIDINIKVLNLTVGLDGDGNFYMTLLGDLDKSTFLSATVTDDWLMGFNIAYSSEYGGYLVTCANNLGTESAEYRVMTLEYLTDNLLKSDSCLKFMLGTNSTIWSLICSGLEAGDISLDSGISTPDELYLTSTGYTLDSVSSDASSDFDITQIITGINAYIDGESYSCGTTDVSYGKLSSQIGENDYYAIDLNNDTIDSLTGGGITEAYAAILRNADGISGLVANGSIGGVMSFTLNLTYNEGIDTEYDLLSGQGTLVYEQVALDESGFAADSYYTDNGDGTYSLASEYVSGTTYYAANYSSDITSFYAPNLYSVVAANYGQEPDYDRSSESFGSTNTFGCFKLTYSDGIWTGEYVDQTALHSFMLTVIYPDGTERQFTLKYTSTIYAQASDNTFENGDLYVYYIVNDDGSLTPMGSQYTFVGDTTISVALVGYQVTVNGVVYTFDADTNGYAVTGVSGGYSGTTLALESEINGFEVNSISNGAFGSVFVSGGEYGSVTTIVLPESITTIGGRAFYACTNLQNVVCFADTITLETDGTTSGLGSDHGYPFYDCSSTLTVYYTNLDSSVDSAKCFEYYEYWGKYYPVNTVSSGWTYTDGTVGECDDETIIEVIEGVLANYSGVNVTAEIDSVTTAVQNAVDKYMLETYGYVGYYRVELSASTQLDGRYNTITANVKSGYGEYYKLEITEGYGKVEISSADDNIYYYDGAAYVQAGTSVVITVSDIQTGYNFSGFTASTGSVTYENGEYSYEMPAQASAITAKYTVAEVDVTVYSEISFTYDFNGTEMDYTAGTDGTITAVEGAALTTALTAAESGYYFLGWAQVQGDGSLQFIGSDVTAQDWLEVYAIWGYSSQTVTSYTAATSGTAPSSDLTSAGGTFYNWYMDSGFTEELTSISTANTVVYARWQFTLSMVYNGSSSTTLYLNGSSSGSYNSYTYSVSVLEGYTVDVTYTVYSKTTFFTTTAYTTSIVTIYDESGAQVSSASIYFSTSGKSRYLYPTAYVGGWSVTTTGSDSSRINSDSLCSSYATSAAVNQNLSISYGF